MTTTESCGTPERVSRTKLFPDRITLPLAKGVLARIDAAKPTTEPRVDFIREAIEREIKRRSRQKP